MMKCGGLFFSFYNVQGGVAYYTVLQYCAARFQPALAPGSFNGVYWGLMIQNMFAPQIPGLLRAGERQSLWSVRSDSSLGDRHQPRPNYGRSCFDRQGISGNDAVVDQQETWHFISNVSFIHCQWFECRIIRLACICSDRKRALLLPGLRGYSWVRRDYTWPGRWVHTYAVRKR